MSSPVEIDFQGMDAQPAARDAVAKQIARFERRFGPIAAGRVVVKSPDANAPARGRFEVNIELSLPDGRNVLVGQGPQSGKRCADLNVAINDAFKWARTAAL
jgi:ribosome-associated translation inhibitor RaiA